MFTDMYTFVQAVSALFPFGLEHGDFQMAGVLEHEEDLMRQLELYNYYFQNQNHIFVRKESVCLSVIGAIAYIEMDVYISV